MQILGGYVVNAKWSDLQTTAGQPVGTNNVIDQAITQVRALNRAGAHLSLKIRIFAGNDAPGWAKALGGSPITIFDPTGSRTGTIGRFWSPIFGAAYNDLISQLAARYDEVPEIRDVTISRCMTIFAEPFIRDTADASSVHNLLTAGFTFAADQACHQGEVDAAKVWAHTHSSLSFNPYQHINADGTSFVDEAFTDQMMAYCRATLGPRCVLENNSIRFPQRDATGMYRHIQQLGPPIAFQTAATSRIGDLRKTIEWAQAQGAGSVELPQGYPSALSTTDIMQLAGTLTRNQR